MKTKDYVKKCYGEHYNENRSINNGQIAYPIISQWCISRLSNYFMMLNQLLSSHSSYHIQHP